MALWQNTPNISEHSRNVKNTRLRFVFSIFPPWFQMPVVFYHSVIDGLRPCSTKQFFLQLATQRWRIKNLSSCRRGVTRWQLFSQLATCAITNKMAEISRERKIDWPIPTKLRCKLLRGCYTQAICLATLRKVEGRATFLATRNATIAVAKWGVTHEVLLATCNATFVALQLARQIASCNMAFRLLYC